MPNWKKLIVSGSSAELTTLKITGTSGQSSEGTSLMINSSGVVGTRELGSNAFNSNTYNNYSLPLGSSSTRGGVKIGYSENGKNYPVELSSEKMYVNVPWTDNNTTYSVGDGGLTQKNFTTTLKNKLDGIAASATNVTNNNQISNGAGYITSFTNTVDMGSGFIVANTGGTSQFTIVEDNALRFAGSGATSVAFNSTTKKVTISSTDTNTTYSVGDGGLTQKNFTTTLKSKLDGIASSATNVTNNNQLTNGAGYITSFTNTVDMGDGFKIANEDGDDQFTVTENEEIRFAGSGATSVAFDSSTQKVTISSTDNNTTYSVGDGGLSQKNFTTTLKSKLDGIASSANNYSLPAGSSSTRGGFKIGYSENGKNYPVELSSEKMYVNVPWTDNNTTYSVGDGGLTQKNFTTTLKSKLDGIAASATNVTNNNQLTNGAGYITSFTNTVDMGDGFKIANSGGTDQFTVTENEEIRFAGSGATSVSFDSSTQKVTISSTDNNTTYSVGDGGLTQKNFTSTLKTKLDGIATSATNVTNNNQISNGAGYRTSAQVDAAIATVVDSAPSALNTLNELAAALGDDSDFAGSVTTSLSGKLSTSGKAADSNLLDGLDLHTGRNNEANKVVRTDGNGYANFGWINTTSGINSGTLTRIYCSGDSYIRYLSPSSFLTAMGIAAGANNYSHPTYNGDDFSVDTGALTGATVVSDIDINVTTDGQGHVTDANGSVATRTLTLANLGYTGATNANYITNNNQLSNGAGYITSFTNTVDMGDGFKIANSGGTDQFTVTENEEIRFAGSGATSVAFDAETQKVTISSTDNNTTYSVGDGGLSQKNFTSTLKSKLDGIASSANNYSLPLGTSSARGGFKIGYSESGKNYPVELSSEKMYVNVPWTDNNTTYSVGDGGLTQNNFTDADHTKLNGIAASANNYSLPLSAAGTRGGVKIGYSENGKNYPVELSSEKMYVNVPWTDNNTTYSVGDGGLTQNNFTDADHTKLNGIATSANNYSHPTGAGNKHIPTGGSSGQFLKYSSSGTAVWASDNNTTYSVGDGGLTSNNFTDADHTKLNGIAASATNVTNNNQLTNGAGYITSYTDTNTVDMGDGFKIANEDGDDQFTVTENEEIRFAGSGATSVAFDAETQKVTISSTDNNTTYSVGDGGLSQKNFTTTLKSKLDGIAASATNVTNNNQLTNGAGYITSYTDTNTVDMGDGFKIANSSGTDQFTVTENEEIRFAGSGATSVAFDSSTQKVTISSTDNNTTYSVGDGGLSQKNFTTTLKNKLDGIAASATNVTNNNQLTNGAGYITSYTDTNTVDMGDGFEVEDGNSTPAKVTITENKKLKFVNGSNIDIRFTDTDNGSSSDPFDLTISSTNTTYSAGSGLTLSGTSFSHTDTSGQASVNNSNNTVIQDITLDTYGHVTGLASKTISIPGSASDLDGYDEINISEFQNDAGYVTSDTNTVTQIRTGTNSYNTGNIQIDGSSDYGMTFTEVASGTYAIRLLDDRRRNSSVSDIYTGNTHDYVFFDASHGQRFYTSGAEEMRLENDGDLHVDGDVIAYSTTVSDERLKDNVTTIENPLDKIKALRGVEYDWNAGSRKGKHDLGLIAQEVEKVIPNIVHEHQMPLLNDDEEDETLYKTVDYEKMVAVLIEGMKEQQTQIDSLKSELTEIKGKL